MNRYKHKVLGLGLAAGLGFGLVAGPVFAEAPAGDKHPSAEAMAFDGILVRPVSFVGSIVSTVFFVVTLPFSAIGGNVDEAAQSMVVKPLNYTFTRPLGEDK